MVRCFDPAVDAAGNVYVTGASFGVASELDFATIKYSPSGDTLWVRRYDGAAHGDDEAFAVAVDDAGYVYVTGVCGNGSYATIKYTQAGAVVEETPNFELRSMNFGPAIVPGVLNLQPVIDNRQSGIVLIDAAGSKVLDLHAGANDVRHLASGVYFVRETQTPTVRRVVLTR